MVFNDIGVAKEEEIFDTTLCVSNVGEILVLVFECEWFNETLVFEFEWLDETLVFIFDCKWMTSIKGG
jgi:hypothetical protein